MALPRRLRHPEIERLPSRSTAREPEVGQRVVRDALDQVRRDDQRPERGDEEGVAIGRRALDPRGADGAGGAGLVLDDEGLPEGLRELRADRAGDRVGGAAGREGHDERDGLLGPGLGVGARDGSESEGEEGEELLHVDGSCRVGGLRGLRAPSGGRHGSATRDG